MNQYGITLVAMAALCVTTSSGAAQSESATKEVSMTATEYGFSPSTLAVRAGQRLKIQITNKGTMNHEFISPLFKAAKDVEIKVEGAKVEAREIEEVEFPTGKTVTIELTPTKAGKFQFWCGEKADGKLHRDLGMKGTIQVTR